MDGTELFTRGYTSFMKIIINLTQLYTTCVRVRKYLRRIIMFPWLILHFYGGTRGLGLFVIIHTGVPI